MSFPDHFSLSAEGYAAYRPDYPDALFAELARLSPATDLAWDCATGSGQAALGLARHFDRVIASDASTAQISHAVPHPRIKYRIASAESSGLADESVALITVAQAIHWFDLERFWAEAARVLRPGGVLAAWCYGAFVIEPAIDALLDTFYSETVGPYWPPERRMIESRYRGIAMPLEELPFPTLWMEKAMMLPTLAGYLGTWSSVQRYREALGHDPVAPLIEALRPLWGAGEPARVARWEIGMRVGRRR
ncbi:MAG TPA: class I SAM-dependent methyltransferase [Gemmatimonadaceae bacterium]|nr:class I SAM-dependent methyltransferase [Gemmatimonadaceae bacterium]